MTQPSQGESVGASTIAAATAPELDFIDAPPPPELPEWPPVGAYPGEPGHHPAPPDLPVADPPAADPAAASPPVAESSVAGISIPGFSVLDDEDDTVVLERIVVEHEVVEGEPVWHQPPPTEPFHARHEKPGEWQTEPPEHLAWEHSPPAEVEPGVQHDQPTEAIPLSMLPHPWEVPFDPHATETVPAPPVRHRRSFWVAVALGLTLLIFAGGAVSAFLLLRNADSGKGAPDPATAVNRFMTAVYTQQDPATAGDAVCREARDTDRLKSRIDQIKGYANEYDAPSFRWNDPAVSGQSDERATVAVQLTMTTDDEKTAQQQLTFTVVHKTGWLVCDVTG